MSPILRIKLSRVVTVVTFWIVAAALLALIEHGVLGDTGYYPSTGNPYDPGRGLVMNSLMGALGGLLLGLTEVFWLGGRLRALSLGRKLATKTGFYLLSIVVLVCFGALISNSLRLGVPLWSSESLAAVYTLVADFAFASIVLYFGVVSVGTLFLLDISETLGQGVLKNFMLGTYHRPLEEERVFMFLDLKSSTSVAEELGHVRYFAFLNDFFKDLTEPILATHGVIYQYVGDEIVISWTPHEGLKGDRCIRCFFECRTAIESRASYYRHVYGVVPAFRAGMHIGRATVGEVGSMKKEIVFSGDALNTCARIQSLCKEHEKDLLVSGELADALTEAGGEVAGENMGEVSLRGRRRPVRLVAIAT